LVDRGLRICDLELARGVKAGALGNLLSVRGGEKIELGSPLKEKEGDPLSGVQKKKHIIIKECQDAQNLCYWGNASGGRKWKGTGGRNVDYGWRGRKGRLDSLYKQLKRNGGGKGGMVEGLESVLDSGGNGRGWESFEHKRLGKGGRKTSIATTVQKVIEEGGK